MFDFRNLASGYYSAIDQSDVERVLQMFAEDAVYDRAGVEYRHLPSIRQFFSEGRQVSGVHIIKGLWSDEESRTVFVSGRFEGQDATGTARSFGFADVWHFNDAGLVSKRESFLALGNTNAAR